MKKIWSLIYHRVVWTIGAALLAGAAAQAMLGLVLKALGLLHSTSLHAWLLDVGHNMGPLGALGGLGAGAAAAGAAGSPPPPKDKDPDPCASQAEDVLKASSRVDTLKDYLKSVEDQIDALNAPINALAANAATLVSDVHMEVAEQAALTLMTKVVEGLMVAMGDPAVAPELLGGKEAAEAVETVSTTIEGVTKPLSQVPGYGTASGFAEDRSFWREMNQYFQAYQGNIESLKELASANNMPTVTQFVNVMEKMNEEIDKGQALLNRINNPNNGIQQQLDEAQQALTDAQKALKDCQDSNSGGGGAGADA